MIPKIIIAKPKNNALQPLTPDKKILDSEFGTLKLIKKGVATLTIDAIGGNTSGEVTIDHNLGYYPFVEVYLLDPQGFYGYCPNFNGGASTVWTTGYRVTKNQIKFYAEEGGFIAKNPSFSFVYFIFKNNLKL